METNTSANGKTARSTGKAPQLSPNGGKYIGEYRDGKRNGQGTATAPDGKKYVGEWDGAWNGQGANSWPDGEQYVGEFKDNKYNGQGTYTLPDGRKYVGEFKGGIQNGQGTQTWPDGGKYVGKWKDGKRSGYGALYSSDGSVKQFGVWKDDILVESSAENSSNKAATSALGIPEKTDGYLPLILSSLLIGGGIAIAIVAIFLRTDRLASSIRDPNPIAPMITTSKSESAQLQDTEKFQQSSPAVKTCVFDKYPVFKGRASRSEFWWFVLFGTILGILVNALSTGLWVLTCIAFLLPHLAVSVRRLHDKGISGWWLLLQYTILWVPGILLFFMFMLKGTDGSIHYGDDQLIVALLAGVGGIGAISILIVFMSKGTDGPNRYGDDPLFLASCDAGQVTGTMP
jgi:uncharacterized membrane protein YhaH (DUF805 family)